MNYDFNKEVPNYKILVGKDGKKHVCVKQNVLSWVAGYVREVKAWVDVASGEVIKLASRRILACSLENFEAQKTNSGIASSLPRELPQRKILTNNGIRFR